MKRGGTLPRSTFGFHTGLAMKKLLNKPWFVATLALIALFVTGRSVLPWLHMPEQAADAPVSTEPETAAAADTPPSIEAALQALTIPTSLRDPGAARVHPEEARVEPTAPDFVDTVLLSALWTQDGETLVLINGRILQAGDEIGRLKIESASQEGVWVRHWKGRDFILLGGTFTLNTPAARSAATSPL
jgi:hypothetical protein